MKKTLISLAVALALVLVILLAGNVITIGDKLSAASPVLAWVFYLLLAAAFRGPALWLLKLAGILVISSIINDVYCIFQWLNGSPRPEGFLRVMSTAVMLSMGVPVLTLLFVSANRKIKY